MKLNCLITIDSAIGGAAPPLGNSLASIKSGMPFMFWAALIVIGMVILGFFRETGWKAKKRQH